MSNLHYYTALIQNLNSIKCKLVEIDLSCIDYLPDLDGQKISKIKEDKNYNILKRTSQYLHNQLLDCYNAICELYFSSIEQSLINRIIRLHAKELYKFSERYNTDQEFSKNYPFISKVLVEIESQIEKLDTPFIKS